MSLIHSVNFMADEPKQDFVTKPRLTLKKKFLVKTAYVQ